MNCNRLEPQLIAYLDGRARDSERREVESHLAVCEACWTRAEEFRRLWVILDESPGIEPSSSFDAAVRARVSAEPPPARWGWLMPSPRLAFAVACLLMLSVWISSLPPVTPENPAAVARSEEDFRVIKDLPVLEDYDVLANFEALSELPPAQAHQQREM